jgi:hypothetical protein
MQEHTENWRPLAAELEAASNSLLVDRSAGIMSDKSDA